MASIKLKFRKGQGNGTGTLFFQVIHNRVVKQVSTGIHLFPEEWDGRRGRVVPLSVLAEGRRHELDAVRGKVEWECRRIRNIVEALEESGGSYSAADVVRIYKVPSSGTVTVYAFAWQLADRMESLGRTRTADCYRTAVNRLRGFLGGMELTFDMMDADLMERFEAHLLADGLCRNTTSYYMRNLRSVYNKAVGAGLAPRSAFFEKVYTGIDKTDKRALSWRDISKLKHLGLPRSKSLNLARDLFLFSFYAIGMPFIDMAYLRKKNLRDGYVTYYRKKTGRSVTFKWRKEMQDIVDKYGAICSPYMLPIIKKTDGTERRQYRNRLLQVNRQLKQVAHLAGINQTLTMHVARHTWATIARDKGIATDDICKVLGHDSVRTTEIYLSTIRNNKTDRINDLVVKGL